MNGYFRIYLKARSVRGYVYFCLLAVVGVIGHLKREERKVGAGKYDFAVRLWRLVGGRQWGGSGADKGLVQTVASLTANLDGAVAAADSTWGQDSSW